MCADRLPRLVADSSTVSREQQFALWAAFLRGYTARPLDTDGPFPVYVEAWNLGDIVVHHGRIAGVCLERSERHIRTDGEDYYRFMMLLEGSWQGKFGHRTASARAGDIYSFDLTQPLSTVSPGNSYITVLCPRRTLDEVLPPMDLHALPIGGAPGRLLGDYLRALVARLPELAVGEAPGVGRATRDLIAAMLGTLRPPPDAPAPAAVFGKARRYIRTHLDRPLDAAGIARELGTSRATLYRAFDTVGGVKTFVRQQRLAHAHELLSRPGQRLSIAEIAFQVGFASQAHFSRLFRERFGYTPGTLRRIVHHGTPRRSDAAGSHSERYLLWKDRLR